MRILWVRLPCNLCDPLQVLSVDMVHGVLCRLREYVNDATYSHTRVYVPDVGGCEV